MTGAASIEAVAPEIAGLIRRESGRRWVGIYRVIDDLVGNLAWSGPGPTCHPTFRVAKVSAGDERLFENVAAGAPLRVRSAIRPGRLTRVLWRDAGRPRRLG